MKTEIFAVLFGVMRNLEFVILTAIFPLQPGHCTRVLELRVCCFNQALYALQNGNFDLETKMRIRIVMNK
jgi:hypothetical protein